METLMPDLLPELTQVKRKRRSAVRYASLALLKALFDAEGYKLEQFRGGVSPNFRLTSNTEPQRWGWIINPADDSIVRRPRDLTMEEWRTVIKHNVRRLNALKIA